MLRKYVTMDGEVLYEMEYSDLMPIHKCFYCDQALITCQDTPCTAFYEHDFIELVKR